MPCRFQGLSATIEGYARTGVHLVSYNSPCFFGVSNTFGPAGLADDVGSYYFIPRFVELTGLPLYVVIPLFYTALPILALVIGATSAWRHCETPVGKWLSVLALAGVTFIVTAIGDYYVYAAAIPIGLIPLWLYVNARTRSRSALIFCGVAGFVIAFGHLMRSHSGTAALLVILITLLSTKRYSRRVKAAGAALLAAGMLIVFASFHGVVANRVAYLTAIHAPYELEGRRIMWHNMYYSLGYLNNNFGFEGWPTHEVSDRYSVARALSINPKVKLFSPAYERILRREYFKFIRAHPLFFITTIFAKLGIVLMYVLIFANVGLYLTFRYRPSGKIILLFAVGIGFNMTFGLIATPEYQYLCGLFAFATMYAIYTIDNAIHLGFAKRWLPAKASSV